MMNKYEIKTQDRYQYQVGGSLKVNAPTYVTRKADSQLYSSLLSGSFCYVFNCRQMGKSSLRVRVKNRLEKDGYACVSLDMTNIGSKGISPGQWYKSIASELCRGLKLNRKFKLKSWWQETKALSPIKQLDLLLCDIVLSKVKAQKIFIFIDEIDSVLSLDFPCDDFFALIRCFYNQRAENKEFNRLSFALFGVATPRDLISDRTKTPFNIGEAIELAGFTLEEATPLVGGLQGGYKYPKIVLQEILNWTGGQPFLTQKLCKLAALRFQKAGNCPIRGSESDWVADLVNEKIINNWEAQDEPEHLKTIRDRLLRNSQTASRLLELAEEILNNAFIRADDSPEQRELLLTNLVVKQNGQLVPRNLIYQKIFHGDWIAGQLQQLRPYGREVEFWLASKCQDNSRLLRGRALKEAQAWANYHNISQAEYQFLTASAKQEQKQIRKDLEFKRLQEVETRLIQEQKLARLQQFLLTTVGTALAVTVGLGAIAYFNYRQASVSEVAAKTNHIEANITSAESLFDSHRHFESLIHAIEAKKEAQKFPELEESTRLKTDFALEQAAYNVVEKNTFSGHLDIVNGVSFSPDGKLIASASSDNTVKIWRRDGTLIATLKGHLDSVIDVAFSSDGRLIASVGEDNTLRLWTRQGQLKQTLTGHQGSVHKVAFSPTENIIATASEDKTVRLWDTNGKLLNVLTGHTREILAVTFRRDGKLIATGDREGNLKLWTSSGTLLRSFTAHTSPNQRH